MRDASDVFPDDLRTLLHAADDADREAAWSRLLAKHSALLLHVSRTVAPAREDSMDAYAMILEQLRADDFRRLRAYEADGRSKFTTWLVVVVQRLCLDFVRHKYGRHRDAADEDGHRSVASISRRQLRDLPATIVDLAASADDHAPGPDLPLREQELHRRLAEALGELTADDRLLLKLRFEDGLTAREIATLLGWPTQFHVYRQLNAITAGLRRRLAARGVESSAP
jgi:RNA polymerase sigma factor (sigma-70 family)